MGDRGPIAWVVVTMIAALATVLLTVRWLDTRGLRIVDSGCAWAPDRGGYVATVTIENRDALYKVVQTTVQGRFRPTEGRQWPHPSLRTRYEAVTQPVQLLVTPRTTATTETLFAIPGVEAFRCEARAAIVGQQRFTEPPDPAVLDAMSAPAQGAGGSPMRRRLRP